MIAISGAHTLLTNLVVAWNTQKMQATVERWRKSGQNIETPGLRAFGPAHFAHINFRGAFQVCGSTVCASSLGTGQRIWSEVGLTTNSRCHTIFVVFEMQIHLIAESDLNQNSRLIQ